MKPGRELDALVAEKVMGWSPEEVSLHVDSFHGWSPSTRIDLAWQVVERLAPLAGQFRQADGYFKLLYGESGDHGNDEGSCDPGPCRSDDNDNDLEPWSCHFHPGMTGESSEASRLWGEGGKWFCSRGETAPHAICQAALRAMGHPVDDRAP